MICQSGYVRRAGKKGRGVFARRLLKAGETVEVSPYIELRPRDYNPTTDTILNAYRYEVKGKWCAIGLGHTSLYNHSEEANAEFFIHSKRRTITIKASKAIRRNEEITINYGYRLE